MWKSENQKHTIIPFHTQQPHLHAPGPQKNGIKTQKQKEMQHGHCALARFGGFPVTDFQPPTFGAYMVYTGTKIVPSSYPTGWAMLVVLPFTTDSMHFTDLTLLRRKACFRGPKHQSGANLVCPAIMKWRLMVL